MIKIHLSRLLGEKRMPQSLLAQKTGIRPATINEIYNELSERVNLEHLDRICEVLECDISQLIEYIPSPIKTTGKDLVKDKEYRKNGKKISSDKR